MNTVKGILKNNSDIEIDINTKFINKINKKFNLSQVSHAKINGKSFSDNEEEPYSNNCISNLLNISRENKSNIKLNIPSSNIKNPFLYLTKIG